MLANTIILFVAFGVSRRKNRPYLGALVLAAIKFALYFAVVLGSQPLWVCALNGVIGSVIFGALGAGLVYFLRRAERSRPQEVTYSAAGSDRVQFQWEYIPLTVIVLLIVFGEMFVR